MFSDVYVLGAAVHPARAQIREYRLEELVYRTTRAALDDARVTRRQLDNVTLGGSDELDGRPISSMLLATPAGAYRVDEMKVADSGATAFCLAVARMASGDFHLGLVASWCKPSKTDPEFVTNVQAEPFFTRPLGMNGRVADGLFAQAVAQAHGVSEEEAAARAAGAYERAALNSRGAGHGVPSQHEVACSPFEATPLRAGHRAPLTDGAACLVLASERWTRRHPRHRPLARVAGVGWATDSYRLGAERLRSMTSARVAWSRALARAGIPAGSLDVVEVESPTSYHEAAYARVFQADGDRLSPSGGTFAQHPLVCTGLVNAVEAVLQVAGRAGAVQRPAVHRAAAHSCHGFAQQGNVVMVFEGDGRA
ncbi:MAG: thiolase family protein [Actinomycetota bacterium]